MVALVAVTVGFEFTVTVDVPTTLQPPAVTAFTV